MHKKEIDNEKLKYPKNIRIMIQPPCSPELNPNKIFDSMSRITLLRIGSIDFARIGE